MTQAENKNTGEGKNQQKGDKESRLDQIGLTKIVSDTDVNHPYLTLARRRRSRNTRNTQGQNSAPMTTGHQWPREGDRVPRIP